jgi:hypothetical protein
MSYFRFSKWVESRRSLLAWADWFSKRKIPWCITKKATAYSHSRRHPGNLFALWRQGEEAKIAGYYDWNEKLTGEIIISWHWEENNYKEVTYGTN